MTTKLCATHRGTTVRNAAWVGVSAGVCLGLAALAGCHSEREGKTQTTTKETVNSPEGTTTVTTKRTKETTVDPK